MLVLGGPLEPIGRLDHPAIREASGIVASRRYPGIFWVHNDSGNPPALYAVRRDGYSICVGELEQTLYGASSAVLNERQRPVAIISVWGPQHRVSRERLPEIGRETVRAAAQIRKLLA